MTQFLVPPLSCLESQAERSRVMRSVPSTGTSLERRAQAYLTTSGHNFRANAEDLPGRPDLVFDEVRIAVFIHGCFWHRHGCRPEPKTNQEYWYKKRLTNQRRDRRVARVLRHDGWAVLTIWGCRLDSGLGRLEARLTAASSRH
ncbi:MAG: very short patch repair endonuclease [Dehalococcoidia bacterium]